MSHIVYYLVNGSEESIKLLENVKEYFKVDFHYDDMSGFYGRPLSIASAVKDLISKKSWKNTTLSRHIGYELQSLKSTPSVYNIDPKIKNKVDYKMSHDTFSKSLEVLENMNKMRQYAMGLEDYYQKYEIYMHWNNSYIMMNVRNKIDEV